MMGRPQEFDRDEVLDQAMMVFWRQGFEGTSVQDLVDATGLNRGSLYNTFGDKGGLFMAVMEHYSETSVARILFQSDGASPPRETIEGFFAALIDSVASDEEHKGCLVVNAAAELASQDAQIARWIRTIYDQAEEKLTALVARGQEMGEFTTEREARAVARFLIGCAKGMLVIAKVNPDPQYLRDIADGALGGLD